MKTLTSVISPGLSTPLRDDDFFFSSADPRFANLDNTPNPVKCQFCEESRFYMGFELMGTIRWNLANPTPCSCPEEKEYYMQELAVAEVAQAAEKKAKADAQMRDKVKRLVGESGMGERFLQRTFESYITDSSQQKAVYKLAKDYAESFEQHLPRRGKPLPGQNGFLISGGVGTGKTHIAAAIANHLLNQWVAVICMSERSLFEKIRRTFSKSGAQGLTESDVLSAYLTVPLLVIDDVGKEKASEWTLATLYSIIDGRYERALPIIITTNYQPQNLAQRITPYGADHETAAAIIDRLTEMCTYICVTGQSQRQLI